MNKTDRFDIISRESNISHPIPAAPWRNVFLDVTHSVWCHGDMFYSIWLDVWSKHERCLHTVTAVASGALMCCLLTGRNFESEGVLLLDGVCEEEASIAAVVRVRVLAQNVGEVQVSIQTHGHSLILLDRTHSYKMPEEHS